MRSSSRRIDCAGRSPRVLNPGRRFTPSRIHVERSVDRTPRRGIAGGTLAFLLSLATAAHAGTAQTSFVVTASVVAVCEMTASALSFPNYLPGSGTTLHATATLSIQCSSGTNNPTLSLNAGSSGGTMANRLMLGPSGSKLQYNIYTSASYSTVLGDGTGGSSNLPVTIPSTAFTTPVTVTVYGQLLDSAANQTAAAGSYSDTVTATLTY